MTTRTLAAVIGLVACGQPALAGQLDPLLPLESRRPTVLVALDLSSRMQRDALGAYLDPAVFDRTSAPFEASLAIDSLNTGRFYRRRYQGLAWRPPGGDVRATTVAIEVVGDRQAAFAEADARTRLGRVRAALLQMIEGNSASTRFGLITTRQASPRVDAAAGPVIESASPDAGLPTDTGVAGRWRAGIPTVDGSGAGVAATGAVVPADASTATADLCRILRRQPGTSGALLPAGFDAPGAIDAPLGNLLDDARLEAARLAAADDACRNTVAVLIAGGGDPSMGAGALGDRAARLVSVGGRRVPVYVVAIAPDAGDTAALRQVASRSGGQYFEVPADVIERAPASEVVPEIVAALNTAVQHGFASFADFNLPPTPARPYGQPSYFPGAGPVVGTVNLENGTDATGAVLPGTRVTGPNGEAIPQRANVIFTAGYELPGFLGRLSAFRVYRPVADERQAAGYRFVSDGVRLWTAVPPSPEQRNVFTVLPGVGVVPFKSSAAAQLGPFLRVGDPARLIDKVRALPLGAILTSTPALLEPPSMRFADPSYGAFADAQHARRAIVFAGAEDGMMHAFDARTGLEVWAVIPFNLLPKLRHLAEGLPIDTFPFTVGGSPRLADVRVGGAWRTYLLFGEAAGGTFYQVFDVTLDGIAGAVPPDRDPVPALLSWFADERRIPFAWSFPRYAAFDPVVPPDGDVAATASGVEKTVGDTWSTPGVGRVGAFGPFVALLGSGGLPRAREQQPQREGVRAGTRVYMVDMADGSVVDSADVGTDGLGEAGGSCTSPPCGLKNGLVADATIVADAATGAVSAVYEGDLDGRLWRFDVSADAARPRFNGPPRLLFDAGSDQPIAAGVARLAGSAGQAYLFIGTGSDLLPIRGGSGYRLVGLTETGVAVTRQFERLLRSPVLDGIDETPVGTPVVAGAVAFFSTNASPASGCAAPEASVYALTVAGGAAYDVAGDGRRDARLSPVVYRAALGRAGPATAADRHVFVATGDRVQVLGDPEGFLAGPVAPGLRIISWREVRRP
jgi:hypothetical protein